jgi:hypothetical protein
MATVLPLEIVIIEKEATCANCAFWIENNPQTSTPRQGTCEGNRTHCFSGLVCLQNRKLGPSAWALRTYETFGCNSFEMKK